MPLDAGFLSMLTMEATWTPAVDVDDWGNEEYGTPVVIPCFVTSHTVSFGQEDGQNKQDRSRVDTIEVLTDAVGINLKDKIEQSGVTYFVNAVDTPQDELGTDLMHTVTASTTQRG